MKKYLLLLLLLFVPFMVKAESELTIEKVEFVEKSELAEVVEEPTFEGKKINLDVKFHNLNDYIKYKITLKNNTDKNYDINSEQDLTEYVKVGFEPLSENDNVLEANSTKEVYFIISYDKEVPKEKFVDGSSLSTEEIKSIEFTIKDDKLSIEENPYTNTAMSAIVFTILLISGIIVTLLIVNKKSFKAIVIVTIIATIAVPLSIYALEKITIDVDSKIVIKHPSFYFKTNLGDNEKIEYLFEEGMTWHEFLESNYNTTTWQESKIESIFYTHQYQEIEESTNIRYFENDKTGISTGIEKWSCNWYQSLDSYESLHYLDDYAYADDIIVNGGTYVVWGHAC